MTTTKNNIPAGYKDSAVGIIPQEWEVKSLGDLCHNTGDYGINAPAVPYSEDLPTYLRITDIDNWGKFIKDNKVSVDNPNSLQYVLKDGDIVFARTGATVGKTYLYDSNDGRLVYAGFLIRFSPNTNKVVPYYIKTYTETSAYWNWVRIISQRSGQPGINSVEYGSLKLAVPPMEEQRKIAEILGIWDEAIEKQSRLIERLEVRKRGLMQRLLTGKTRLPGFTEPWQKVKLGEISTIKKGVQVNKNTLQEYGKYPTINGGIEPSGYSDNYNTEANTITISEGGNSCGYVNFITTKFWSGGHCYTITPLNNIKNLYLYHQLKYFEPRIMIQRVGSGLPNIQFNILIKFECFLPTLLEQTAIAEVLSTADKEIAIHSKTLDALRLQKRGLMQQLLTGKTRVKI